MVAKPTEVAIPDLIEVEGTMGTTKSRGKPKDVERRPAIKRGGATAGGSKRRAKKSYESYKIYIYKVLKQVHPKCTVSSMAMGVMNSFITDMLEKLTREASGLARNRKKPTLAAREIQGAVKLTFPGELAKHALVEGTNAVKKYTSSAIC